MCGGDRGDWAVFLSGAYPRTVVSRVLTEAGVAFGSSFAATAGTAGWSVTRRGRMPKLHARFDGLIDDIASALAPEDAGDFAACIRAASPHRPLQLDRRAVPSSRHGDPIPEGHALPISAADHVIHDIVAASILVRFTGGPGRVTLEDAAGSWTLLTGPTQPVATGHAPAV